ncbi:MAG: FAD/NAD(P)-binding protein [Sphingobacteriales bacterium]
MKPADIVIIGSGIACTSTLIEVFNRLIEKPADHKLSITVIEKNREFWLGIPYGSRSSVNALTITSIYDFFTDKQERDLFLEWFHQNKSELLSCYQQNGGTTAEQWLQRNAEAIKAEDWKNVYLPRYICGKYLQQKFDTALRIVEEKGLVELTLINCEAKDIQYKDNGYMVSYELTDRTTLSLWAAKVVIATGSAPVRNIDLPIETNALTVVNDLYHPGAEENIQKLATALSSTKNHGERNVLIIGSNASSIEFLYLLAGQPKVISLINKLVVISRSGLLPYHIIDDSMGEHLTDNLYQLKKEGSYTIETLVEAAKKDINIAVKDGVIIPYIDKIIGFTFELLQPLDEDAKKAFIGIYGMQLSSLFRRSGVDYKTGSGLLHELEKLVLLKGSFDKIDCTDNVGKLHYTANDPHQKLIYPEKFKVVVNCTGSDDLGRSSSKLIYNLVHNGIAAVNLSGKGFLVNERFEAAPNLYVIGPLLGGNKNERIHFWHLENASRIMYLAPYLAECLVSPTQSSPEGRD